MGIITIIALVVGPVVAVLITLWHQNRDEKRKRKFDLFKSLMVNRRYFCGMNQEWVNSLNLIDIVFHDHPSIIKLWHEYHDMLSAPNRNYETENRKILDLLLEIAKIMGYAKLKQTDIDRFYLPVGLNFTNDLSLEIQKENLKYLQNVNKLYENQTTIKTSP